MRRVITLCGEGSEMAERAADRIVEVCAEAAKQRGQASVALSGGRTPRDTYGLLGRPPWRDRMPWEAVHIFWGDERCIALERPDNHFQMATELFLGSVPIPEANVHRVPVELRPDEAASEYEQELRRHFSLRPGETPRFDLAVLGMGADGHTASIFPGTPAEREGERLAMSHYVPKVEMDRITLTFRVFDACRAILFLVSGAEKAEALAAVLGGRTTLPASRIRPDDGVVQWIVDEGATAHVAPTSLAAEAGVT